MFARGSPRATAPRADPGGMLPAPDQEGNGTDSAPVLPDLGSELCELGNERALMIRAIREILGVEKGPNGAVLGSFLQGVFSGHGLEKCLGWVTPRQGSTVLPP